MMEITLFLQNLGEIGDFHDNFAGLILNRVDFIILKKYGLVFVKQDFFTLKLKFLFFIKVAVINLVEKLLRESK